MENGQHAFSELFAQLGLPNSEAAIQHFIAQHPLPNTIQLADADFWTPAQAGFIRESWRQDADWSAVIDQLNNSLHRA
ncbi:MAG: DUF2789 domain-containing protein [Spongiibacteraceae bacterium]